MFRAGLLIFVDLVILVQLGSAFSSNWALTFGRCSRDKVHTLKYGQKGVDDRLLFIGRLDYPRMYMRVVVEDLYYPELGDKNESVITYIRIEEVNSKEMRGGCAYIKSGGVGETFVQFTFISRRNSGMAFTIKIYGR